MVAEATCIHCGEPRHHGYCRPHLAAMLADERLRSATLELEIADLRHRIRMKELSTHPRGRSRPWEPRARTSGT